MTFHSPRPHTGSITLVGAGPGAADLLTFRAARALEQADITFYDRLIDPDVLALARGQRVYVGKAIGAHAWPQARIDQAIVTAALQGKRVVRLKSGDPMIFGRAAEEIAAARAHGIPVAVIPGVTAASAAAAALLEPLTARGETDSVTFATATPCPGTDAVDLAARAKPGTTLVLYMAMQRLDQVAHDLLAQGLPARTQVRVAANASKPTEALLATTLACMAQDCRAAGLCNPAVVLIKVPKAAPATAALRSLSVAHR